MYEDLRSLERELDDDYETLGFSPSLSFDEIAHGWRKLPPAPEPYLRSRSLWPLTRFESGCLRSLENFPFKTTTERASSVSKQTREHFDNAMIASITVRGRLVGFQALLLDRNWSFARTVEGDTKSVKIRITILPRRSKPETRWKSDQEFLQKHEHRLSRAAIARLKERSYKVLQPPEGVVALNPAIDGRIAVAEGIETAMSFTRLTGIPCWARLGVPLVKRFKPPDFIKRLDLAQDRDERGEEIWKFWRQRLPFAGRFLPDPEFNDFNDEWRARNG